MRRTPQSEQALDHALRRWLSAPSKFRYKPILERYEEELKHGAKRSPNSWAVAANTCACALAVFSKTSDRNGWQKFINCSPDRLIRIMALCAKKAKEGCQAYRDQGIDPQVQVTLNPYLEKCRKALSDWREATKEGIDG